MRRADETLEDLKAYEKLFNECGLWGSGSIEQGIKEFRAFRKLNMSIFPRQVERLIESANELHEGLRVFEEKRKGPEDGL